MDEEARLKKRKSNREYVKRMREVSRKGEPRRCPTCGGKIYIVPCLKCAIEESKVAPMTGG